MTPFPSRTLPLLPFDLKSVSISLPQVANDIFYWSILLTITWKQCTESVLSQLSRTSTKQWVDIPMICKLPRKTTLLQNQFRTYRTSGGIRMLHINDTCKNVCIIPAPNITTPLKLRNDFNHSTPNPSGSLELDAHRSKLRFRKNFFE